MEPKNADARCVTGSGIEKPRLIVACVLNVQGRCHYDSEYVERLKAGVEKHLHMPHRFVCLSNVAVPCERILLKHDWRLWFAKMELFRLPPPVLYFDLDTIITGDLGDIAAHAEKSRFTMLRDFYREKGFGSGMMSWNVWMLGVYETFLKAPQVAMSLYRGRGDQAFLEDQHLSPETWQDALPGQVVSYKQDVRQSTKTRESGNGSVPEGARVVCFHGEPKPRDVQWKL